MIGPEKHNNMFFLSKKCQDLTSEKFGRCFWILHYLNFTFENEMKNVLFIELFSEDLPIGFDGMFTIFS